MSKELLQIKNLYANAETKEILKEVTQKYVYTYGVDDLSENDKECIRSLIGNEI